MAKIQLTKNKTAVVSDEDYELLSKHSWSYSAHRYPAARVKGKTTVMHRFLLDVPVGMEVDHINRDRLDNRRENLRIVTRKENMQNKSLYKNNVSGKAGMAWYPKLGKYRLYKYVDGKQIHLGYMPTQNNVNVKLPDEKKT